MKNILANLKTNKKYQITLLVISIMLIVSGVSYAYFAAYVAGTSNPNIVTSGSMKITYTDGQEVKLDNAIPGDFLTKTFTVKNTGTVDTAYDIYLSDVVNTFSDQSDLVYTLTSDTGANITSDTQMPSASTKMVSSQNITPNETQSYTLTIKFLNKNEAQDDNQGKLFKTIIKINESNAADLPYSDHGTYQMLAYIDNNATSNMPTKDTGYTVTNVSCTNGATGTWNYSDWALYVKNNTSSTVCSVYFSETKTYVDDSGASYPELYQGMVPVTYDNGFVKVADTSKEWYSYTKHNWANAVLLNLSDSSVRLKYFDDNMKIKSDVIGTSIANTDILQMYTWIPRYKYKLWNANNGSSNPQMINIIFESKETAKSYGANNGEYLTHPAFTFGSTELNGIWVGKFETSGTTSNPTILPNKQSLTNVTISDMFNTSRNIENSYSSNYGIDSTSIDTHMMKNMEWGAAAYLTNSIYGRYNTTSTCIASGCEVWTNNVNTAASGSYGPTITGCAGSSVSATMANSLTTCANGYDWTTLGQNASTTGNINGIYDMAGGNWDEVMGNMSNSSGGFYSSSAGFSTTPAAKYYDSYSYGTSNVDHSKTKLGDAMKETLTTFGNSSGGWYNGLSFTTFNAYSWYGRGGNYQSAVAAGVFSSYSYTGSNSDKSVSFRSVLTAQ